MSVYLDSSCKHGTRTCKRCRGKFYSMKTISGLYVSKLLCDSVACLHVRFEGSFCVCVVCRIVIKSDRHQKAIVKLLLEYFIRERKNSYLLQCCSLLCPLAVRQTSFVSFFFEDSSEREFGHKKCYVCSSN